MSTFACVVSHSGRTHRRALLSPVQPRCSHDATGLEIMYGETQRRSPTEQPHCELATKIGRDEIECGCMRSAPMNNGGLHHEEIWERRFLARHCWRTTSPSNQRCKACQKTGRPVAGTNEESQIEYSAVDLSSSRFDTSTFTTGGGSVSTGG